MTDDLYYRKVESTSTADLVDMVRERDWQIAELEKENKELKCFIRDLIYENHNLCFHSNNTTCLFNSDYRNRAEELTGEKL